MRRAATARVIRLVRAARGVAITHYRVRRGAGSPPHRPHRARRVARSDGELIGSVDPDRHPEPGGLRVVAVWAASSGAGLFSASAGPPGVENCSVRSNQAAQRHHSRPPSPAPPRGRSNNSPGSASAGEAAGGHPELRASCDGRCGDVDRRLRPESVGPQGPCRYVESVGHRLTWSHLIPADDNSAAALTSRMGWRQCTRPHAALAAARASSHGRRRPVVSTDCSAPAQPLPWNDLGGCRAAKAAPRRPRCPRGRGCEHGAASSTSGAGWDRAIRTATRPPPGRRRRRSGSMVVNSASSTPPEPTRRRRRPATGQRHRPAV
jgi:hypothetical protein